MDDYLSKPIDPAALRVVLQRWGGYTFPQGEFTAAAFESATQTASAPVPDCPETPPLDLNQFNEVRNIMQKRFEVLMQRLFEYGTSYGDNVREAATQNDFERLAQLAHTIKGTYGQLDAQAVANLGKKLEELVPGGDIARIEEQIGAIEMELARLQAFLEMLYPLETTEYS